MFKPIISKIRFFISVSALYALALFFAVQAFDISLFQGSVSPSVQAHSRVPVSTEPKIKVVTAKPTRVVVARIGIDLPIIDGNYDPKKKTWTLSDNRPHFAIPSTVLNDLEGNTLIYGHNYDWIFGDLKKLAPGDVMQLYGDNGKVFTYVYESTQKLKPEDSTVFRFDGKPSATLQTCSGRWNEQRQMFNFTFQKVT